MFNKSIAKHSRNVSRAENCCFVSALKLLKTTYQPCTMIHDQCEYYHERIERKTKLPSQSEKYHMESTSH